MQKKGEDQRYYCLDDLKGYLPKEKMTDGERKTVELILKTINNRATLQDVTLADSLRPLEPHEVNKKCLRSVFSIGPNGTTRMRKKKKQLPNMAFGSVIPEKPSNLPRSVSASSDLKID